VREASQRKTVLIEDWMSSSSFDPFPMQAVFCQLVLACFSEAVVTCRCLDSDPCLQGQREPGEQNAVTEDLKRQGSAVVTC